MLAGDGQFGVAVVQKAPSDLTGIGLEVIPAQTVLASYILTGCIRAYDERDSIFSRMELVVGRQQYESYYAAHRERKAADDKTRARWRARLSPLGEKNPRRFTGAA
jgi:hypothetical protein